MCGYPPPAAADEATQVLVRAQLVARVLGILARVAHGEPLACVRLVECTGHVALSQPAGAEQVRDIRANVDEQAAAEGLRGGCSLALDLSVWEVVGGAPARVAR